MLWLRWESWPVKAKDLKNWVSPRFAVKWSRSLEQALSAGMKPDFCSCWG